tara:strand:+ start:87 stop:683 length:597 start_codon:yes stop_codon:yes gene_type:complete
MKRKCANRCGEYAKFSVPMGKAFCSTACCTSFAAKIVRKEKQVVIVRDKKEIKARKDKLNETVKHWTKKAQVAFNKFIRERDINEPCISCGRYDHEINYHGVGGKWDCGHYKTRGAFPELRFNELNAHKQCKSCNGGSGKFAKKARTVGEEYERRLRIKIGDVAVDMLNGPHDLPRYRVQDLKEIESTYKLKYKEIKA